MSRVGGSSNNQQRAGWGERKRVCVRWGEEIKERKDRECTESVKVLASQLESIITIFWDVNLQLNPPQ